LTSLNSQIASLEAKIQQEGQLGASQVKAISPEALRGFQSLDAERLFAEKIYGEALSLRSQAYVMAQNQQSYLALFVKPTLPQKPLYPERAKSIFVVFLAAAAAWFVGMLVVYAVRDHLS
jgi:capsular polysaccharide transport system permease protein